MTPLCSLLHAAKPSPQYRLLRATNLTFDLDLWPLTLTFTMRRCFQMFTVSTLQVTTCLHYMFTLQVTKCLHYRSLHVYYRSLYLFILQVTKHVDIVGQMMMKMRIVNRPLNVPDLSQLSSNPHQKTGQKRGIDSLMIGIWKRYQCSKIFNA